MSEPMDLAACRVKLGSVEYVYPYCGPRDFWLGKTSDILEDQSRWITVDDMGVPGQNPVDVIADVLHMLSCEVEG